MMPDVLRYNDTPFASPAFRQMAWIDGSLADPAMTRAMAEFYDLFLDRFEAGYLMQGGRGQRGKTVKATPKALSAARDWLLTPPHAFPTTLRLANYDEEMDLTVAPHFRVEEALGFVMLEISQPAESPDLAMADQMTRMLTALPLRCGVMGFGFYLPASLDSLIFNLPMTAARYRCAIEILLEGPDSGIIRERSSFPYARFPSVQPGIADIGWRTLVGAPFRDRLSDLGDLAQADGITVEDVGGNYVITVGDRPIWGDVNRGEDISGYTRVAAALASVRFPLEIAKRSLFGGASSDPERVDRVTSYLNRFQASRR